MRDVREIHVSGAARLIEFGEKSHSAAVARPPRAARIPKILCRRSLRFGNPHVRIIYLYRAPDWRNDVTDISTIIVQRDEKRSKNVRIQRILAIFSGKKTTSIFQPFPEF